MQSPSLPAMHSSSTRAADLEMDPPPWLPLELIEAILVDVPLRFPLHKINDYSTQDSENMHKDCDAALCVVAPSPTALKVFVPRLPRGPELILAHPSLFGAGFLQLLHQHGFEFPLAEAFAASLRHNRVDVLTWWVEDAQLGMPSTYHDYFDWDRPPLHQAMDAEAWDALDWLARCPTCRSVCDEALSIDELADLVRTGGERQVQFVVMWLKGGYNMVGYLEDVLEAACQVGAVEVLCTWAECGYQERDGFSVRATDAMARAAIFGRGPAVPVLEWMLSRRFRMPNVAKYAKESGHHQVVVWFEENKAQIEEMEESESETGEGDGSGEE